MRKEIPVIKCRGVNDVRLCPVKDVSAAAFQTLGAKGTEDEIEGAFSLGNDAKTVVLLVNEESGEVKCRIKAGNGFCGVGDLEILVRGKTMAVVTVDSARFKNVHGEDKGKVIIGAPEGGEITVAVLEAS